MKGDCVPDEPTTAEALAREAVNQELIVQAQIEKALKISGLKTPGEGINPKDKIGASKVDFTVIPHSAKVAWALAQMDGVTKYGAYNWRVEPVQIMTYLAAAERHLDAFREGEEVASDSLVHHLGHVMACCAIIIDAMAVGKAIDNRPIEGVGYRIIEDANAMIKTKPPGWGR